MSAAEEAVLAAADLTGPVGEGTAAASAAVWLGSLGLGMYVSKLTSSNVDGGTISAMRVSGATVGFRSHKCSVMTLEG